jgi:hypothetical protein
MNQESRGTSGKRLDRTIRGVLGGSRGVADPILLIVLWCVIALAGGTWGYIEAERSKTVEQSGQLEPPPSDLDQTPPQRVDAPDADPIRVEPAEDLHKEPVRRADALD